jgi:hypothetical protein
MKKVDFKRLRESIGRQKKILKEINFLYNSTNKDKRDSLFSDYLKELIVKLKAETGETEKSLSEINLPKELEEKIKSSEEPIKEEGLGLKEDFVPEEIYSWGDMRPDKIERETFRRAKTKKKVVKENEFNQKVNGYVKLANKLFSKSSSKLVDEKTAEVLERDLSKSNLQFTSKEYISLVALSAIVSFIVALLLIVFFLFFNIGPALPIITKSSEEIGSRLLKTFWLLFLMPIGTALIMFFYPSMEKKAKETKIDREIPFATLNMSAIAGSLIDPTNLFEIIISTKEYPMLSEQFTKLINEINVYGYDLVSVLRNSAYNSPSKKLAELYSGIATTITSGGDLSEFFDKRSESLLFEYGLEKEKKTKAAETFMDIYISVVIAAPMILMILLMMMKISGLGVALSTQAITLIMVISVTAINIIFLSFLEVRK